MDLGEPTCDSSTSLAKSKKNNLVGSVICNKRLKGKAYLLQSQTSLEVIEQCGGRNEKTNLQDGTRNIA